MSAADPSAAGPTRRQFLARGAAGLAAITAAGRIRASATDPAIAPFLVRGDALVVPRGFYFPPAGRIHVPDDTTLRIDPAEVVAVHDEELQLGTRRPAGPHTGTRLQATRTGGVGAFRSLVPESVNVRDATGRWLRRGEEFLVSAPFALIGPGPKPAVAPDDSVYVTYSHYLQRIDSVVVDRQGRAQVLRGAPELATPRAPDTPPDMTAIARVYRPLGQPGDRLTAAQVFPVVATPAGARTDTAPGRLPSTLRKLRDGEPVKLAGWGDAVTAGTDVTPEEAWPARLRDELAARFPRSAVTLVSHALAGTRSAQWLRPEDFPALPRSQAEKCRFEHLLAEQPDVVVMSFLNDTAFDADTLHRTYFAIDEEFRRRGIEWVIVAPNHRVSEVFDLAEMKDEKPRVLDLFLRSFARERGHALADVAARWKHLYREGIPYFALYNNAYNHPNAFGHGLYVEEILACFAAPAGRR